MEMCRQRAKEREREREGAKDRERQRERERETEREREGAAEVSHAAVGNSLPLSLNEQSKCVSSNKVQVKAKEKEGDVIMWKLATLYFISQL